MRKWLFLISFLLTFPNVFAQSAAGFARLTMEPKPRVDFPLRYGFVLPRLEWVYWDDDFNKYDAFLTPALMRTQLALSTTDKGVRTMFNYNSLLPHAQLDTQTIITDPNRLLGTWRVIACRIVRFTDSVDVKTKTFYQFPDTNVAVDLPIEQFAVFSANKFELWTQKNGTSGFKKAFTRKYKLEGKRYLLLSKFLSSPSTGQIGIDERGYLLLHYPRVVERIKKGDYNVYSAIVEQLIFEQVKE